ncbi:MAG: hypothetical protein JAY90_20250 [Candidatus Thiodiazotropha lotti]|nr:hypothetical protein [Candidatus Thiodiazotropha lotti]
MTTIADLLNSQQYASRKDPETYARHLRLAESNKLSIETVERNEKEVEQKEKLKRLLDVRSRLDTNPGLSRYLSNKHNAAVSADDIYTLKGIEDTLKTRSFGDYIQDYSIDLVGKGLVVAGQAAGGPLEAMRQGLWSITHGSMKDGETPDSIKALPQEVQNKLADLTSRLDDDTLKYLSGQVAASDVPKAGGLFEYDPERARQILSSWQSQARQESDAEVAKAEGFADKFGALIDNPDSVTGTVLEQVVSMLGIVAATKRFSTALLTKNGIQPGTKEAVEFFANPATKAKLATMSGVSEGMLAAGTSLQQTLSQGADLDDASIAALGTLFTTAGISKLSSKFLPDAEVELATAGGKSQSLKQGLQQIGKSVVKEGALEEMPQSGFEQVWQNFALDKDLTEGIGGAMAAGLVTGSAMGGAMSSASTTINALTKASEERANEAIESSFDQQKIDGIISYAQSSKTATRSPAQWKEYLHSVGSDQSIYMDAEAARAIPGLPVTIKEQINVTDADIEIPIHEFAEEIVKDEALLEQVRPHIKLRPEASTATELEQGHSSEIESLVQKAMQSQKDLTEAQQIYEEVKDQLIATDRMSESTAATAAKLIPAYVTTTAKRYKKSVGEIYEQMGLKIVGPDANIEEEMRAFHQERVSKVQELLDCLGG